jgi:7-keto-8-aminopelargonate synthetase-like enzyme
MIGAAAGEVMAAVHTSMLAGISYSSANVRYWHKADIPRLSSNVRFSGVKQTSAEGW